MSDYIPEVSLLALLPLALYFAHLLLRTLNTSDTSLKNIRKIRGRKAAVFTGEVPSDTATVRGHYVRAGLCFDKSSRKLLKQGTISNEALEVNIR
jgi:hypothetical protein